MRPRHGVCEYESAFHPNPEKIYERRNSVETQMAGTRTNHTPKDARREVPLASCCRDPMSATSHPKIPKNTARITQSAIQPMTVTYVSHQSDARKKMIPTTHDHQNAARTAQVRTSSNQGTSANHAHHHWLKFGNARMRRLALVSAKRKDRTAK